MENEKLNSLFTNQGLLNNETVIELKLLTEKYSWFQLGWMLYLKNLKEIESADYQLVLKKVAVLVSDRKLLYNYLNSENQKKADKADDESIFQVFGETDSLTENGEGNSLIDKFLQTNPGSIRRVTEEGNSAENENRLNVAEKSVTENDELITDTLAGIYLQQKNYDKALKAYKKLSLKYPEKSIYFAARIEEIEKLRNTNSE
jgi:tetratricopeptide (TPR) repeat protein